MDTARVTVPTTMAALQGTISTEPHQTAPTPLDLGAGSRIVVTMASVVQDRKALIFFR